MWALRATAVAAVGFLFVAPARAQVQLPQIVVTAPSPFVSRTPAPTFANPPGLGVLPVVEGAFVPVTVVTGDELQRGTGSTLGDILFSKPGISASTFAPGAASRPIIRGLDNFRVRIQENGIGSHDVSALGEDHGVPMDPLAMDRIEVIRGPGTLRWGSQAIGGVVSGTNNRIPDMPMNGVSTRLKGAMSSVDNGVEGAALVDAGKVDKLGYGFGFHADAYGRRAGDYAIPGDRQANSGFNSDGQSVGATRFFQDGFVGLAVSRFASLYHVPGTESAARNTRIDLEQIKVTSKGEYRPQSSGIETIRFWLGATDYKHNELGLGGGGGPDGVQATFKNREQEGRVEMELTPLATRLGQLQTALGIQFGHQALGTSGEAGGLLSPADTRRAASFLFNELALTDTLKLQAAGRIESVRVGGTALDFPANFLPPPDDPDSMQRSRSFVPMSASLGLRKTLPGNVVASITGQYVERAPEAPELFSRGAHDAPATFEIGDPYLNKEAARTIEVGLRRAKGDLRFDATAFYTRYKGFIFKRLTGIRCSDEFATCGAPGEDELAQVVYGQRDATFYGVELAAQLDVMPLGRGVFGIDGQYDFVRARFADGTNVPRIPPQRVGAGVFWRDGFWLARVGLLHAFRQDDVGDNETPTASYNLLKAEISYTRKLKDFGGPPIEMTLGITGDNLLDDDIRNHASFKKDEILLPGRNVRFFANIRY